MVFKTLELKSGALVALAMKFGALTAIDTLPPEQQKSFETEKCLTAIANFGSRFGQLLQIYDDIGNLVSSSNPQKRFEDLRLRRPSFIWTILAEKLPTEDYLQLHQQLACSTETTSLIDQIEKIIADYQIIGAGRNRALDLQQQWLSQLWLDLPQLSSDSKNRLLTTLERLSHAY